MYIKVNQDNSKVYPYDLANLRTDFPNVSFSLPYQAADLAPFGVFPVVEAGAPVFDDAIERVIEAQPTFVGGQWRQQFQVLELSESEVAENLAAAKVACNMRINTSRLVANRSTFTHAGKSFSCDELSRSDIDGINGFVALNSALPPGWPGGWKAVDNSIHPIADVAAWKAFYGSMVAAGNANFAKAQTLKAQLAAATTVAEVNAIVW